MVTDVYRLMLVAIACEIHTSEAFKILSQTYIDEFTHEYDVLCARAKAEKKKPKDALDQMILFVQTKLGVNTEREGNLNLGEKKLQIAHNILCEDLSSMIAKLARRKEIADKVRDYMRYEDRYNTMSKDPNGVKFQTVFDDFIESFRQHSAHAFEFNRSFDDFVLFCFKAHYYKGHAKDIWNKIREIDTARNELEYNIVEEKIVQMPRTDDVQIHNLLVNMSLANDLMFSHSGQSDDARGVQYDVFYLLLQVLCNEKIERINSTLGEDLLSLIDLHDRDPDRPGGNKGIYSKITNAKDLIPAIFTFVREGRLSTSSIADLRSRAFELGKRDTESCNCIWVSYGDGRSETTRYLNHNEAPQNYANFDIVLKAVVSAYTLMKSMEERGRYLVDSYNKELFRNPDVIRYMDYLSSIDYIDLMLKLQRDEFDYRKDPRYTRELLEFPEMVDLYAGSGVNNKENIRENRYYAITHGFLVKPRLKQSKTPVTNFEKLKIVAAALDAVPRSFYEYVEHDDLQGRSVGGLSLDTVMDYHSIESGHIVPGSYSNLQFNSFVVRAPEKAAYYLVPPTGKTFEEWLNRLDWKVRQMPLNVIMVGDIYGSRTLYMYNCLNEEYFLLRRPISGTHAPGFSYDSAKFEELCMDYSALQSYCARNATEVFILMANASPDLYENNAVQNVGIGISFPYYIGLQGFNAERVLRNERLIHPYSTYVDQFYKWLEECAQLQYSMVEVIRTIYTYCAWLFEMPNGYSTIEAERKVAQKLVEGFRTGELNAEAFDWILDKIHEKRRLQIPRFVDGALRMDELDLTVINYCYDEPASLKAYEYPELRKLCQQFERPSEKFAAIYNYLYTKLDFLRMVRDAYSLLLSTCGAEAATLICELSEKFDVKKALMEYDKKTNIDYGIYSTSRPASEMRDLIVEVRQKCRNTFKTLVNELIDLITESEEEIAKLVDYNILGSGSLANQFKSYAQAFAMSPAYSHENIPELAHLRMRAACDDAGFFLANGRYFKGSVGDAVYYVHKSGHMLAEKNGKLVTVRFNLNKEDDLLLYRQILRRGCEDAGYKV